jgi:hypothetical protein
VFSGWNLAFEDAIEFASEVTPKPPFLETDLCPVNKPRGTPSARLGHAKRWPTSGIDGAVCGGAARAVSEESYRMQPEIDGPSLPGNLNRQVVRQHIAFLVGNAAGFRGGHVGAVANRVDVVPFRF